jgi:hypothetical protein
VFWDRCGRTGRQLARESNRRLAVGLVALLACLLFGPSPAIADSVSVQGPVLVNGPTPFPGGCPPYGPEPGTEDSAYEPSLFVDSGDPGRLVAAWIQDGGLSIMTGVSRDGGRSWKTAPVPGVSHCSGGRTGGVVDPWLAYGRDGVLYLTTLGADVAPGFPVTNPQTQVAVSRSSDLGVSWSPVVAAQREDGGDFDKPSITVDPRVAGRVYAVWGSRSGPAGAYGVSQFAQSGDGGRSWTPTQTIYVPVPNPPAWTHGNVIVVLADGTLLDFFVLANESPYFTAPLPDAEMVIRSTDGGRTWSAPVKIADVPSRLAGKGNSEARRIDDISVPAVALDPSGTIYVAWHQNPSPTTGAIMLARSNDDGGRSWSAPTPAAGHGGQAFFPALATQPDGTLGLLWYDTRNDTADSSHMTTDVWFAQSHDQGRSWEELHLAGPFDALSGPDFFGIGRTIGDYVSLAATPTGFDALFTQAKPVSPRGATSVYFAAIQTQAATLPSRRACASRRLFVIHLHDPSPREHITSLIVKVNGKTIIRRHGHLRHAPIDLRGLPRTAVTVRMTARTSRDRTLTTTRHYHTCTPRHRQRRR